MPCNENKYLEYTITHEYGHLIHMTLADRELSQYSIFTIRQYTDVMKYIKNRIIDIVRDDNPELTDKDIEALQSNYSKRNEREFFAECFANSQCGKPNALGKAILKYLKNRGI